MSARVWTAARAVPGRPLWSASQATASHLPRIGELFHSFGEAWAAFLAREEPLESFFDRLPEDEGATLDVWVIVPPEPVKTAAAELQRAFAHLDWIEPTPPHFLHVTLGHGEDGEPAAVEPFELSFGPVNCFHEAVIAEVEDEGPGALAASLGHSGPYLPHLTLGYVRQVGPPDVLRKALLPLRDVDLGSQRVEEMQLIHVPASRTTVLEPWTVLRRVRLSSQAGA